MIRAPEALEVPLCRDCKHLKNGERCDAPANFVDRGPDFVTGAGVIKKREWYGAQFCREDAKACGPEARWFEPKERA